MRPTTKEDRRTRETKEARERIERECKGIPWRETEEERGEEEEILDEPRRTVVRPRLPW
jgi:hypothetical protein